MNMQNKRGISEFIAYVLLITLAIGLSVAVYSWLRAYTRNSQTETCPDGVSLIIKEYSCNSTSIAINVSNKGLFKVDGYIFRIGNEVDAYGKPKGLPVIVLNTTIFPTSLNPGESYPGLWSYKKNYGRIVEMEIEPLRISGKRNIFCEQAVVRQRTTLVECN